MLEEPQSHKIMTKIRFKNIFTTFNKSLHKLKSLPQYGKGGGKPRKGNFRSKTKNKISLAK